jgi:hypothetical protein
MNLVLLLAGIGFFAAGIAVGFVIGAVLDLIRDGRSEAEEAHRRDMAAVARSVRSPRIQVFAQDETGDGR